MAVSDSQDVNALVSNAAFASKQQDNTLDGKQDLNNSDAESGAPVTNVQRELNGLNSYTGSTSGSNEDRLPTWVDSSVGTSSDTLKGRSEALTTVVDANRTRSQTNETNIATNTANIATNTQELADTRSAQGTAFGETNIGTFPGAIITDNVSVKTALTELEAAIEGIPAGLRLRGNWDAATNTPTLVSGGAGNAEGDYYNVSVAGSTNLDGETNWEVGDWAVLVDDGAGGQVWDKIDNSETVTSVNGQTGVVVLGSDDVTEGVTNLYNQTHTGDVTGSTALTLESVAITGQTTDVPENGDFLLFSDTSDSGALKKADLADLLGSGSGVGGINYILEDSFNFEGATVGAWVTYDDGATNVPVDGIGGSPAGVTFNTSATAPLRGTNSGVITKFGGSTQGQGISVDFTIDNQDVNKNLYISFDQELGSGQASDDWGVYIYDVTNAQLLNVRSSGSTTRFTGRFSATNSVSYRLILHCQTTNATNYSYKLDTFIVGPDKLLDSPIVSDPKSFTLSITNLTQGNGTVEYANYRRVVDRMVGEVSFVLGSTSAVTGDLEITVPDGLSINPTIGSGRQVTGRALFLDAGTALYDGVIFRSSDTAMRIRPLSASGSFSSQTTVNATVPFTWTTGDSLTLQFDIAIAEWANSSGVISTTEALNENAFGWVNMVGAQSHTNSGGAQIIPFDTVVSDDFGLWNNTTKRFEIKEAGKYQCVASTGFLSSPSQSFANIIHRDSGGAVKFGYNSSMADTINGVASAIVDAIPGDTIEYEAFQNSGGNLAYQNTTNVNFFQIRQLPDLSVYGVFGKQEIQNVNASRAGVVGAAFWYSVPGASVTLPPGRHRLTARTGFGSATNNNCVYFIGAFSDAAATDSAVAPPGVTTAIAGSGSNSLLVLSGITEYTQTLGPLIVESNEEQTVFVNIFSNHSNAATMNLNVNITSERLA